MNINVPKHLYYSSVRCRIKISLVDYQLMFRILIQVINFFIYEFESMCLL